VALVHTAIAVVADHFSMRGSVFRDRRLCGHVSAKLFYVDGSITDSEIDFEVARGAARQAEPGAEEKVIPYTDAFSSISQFLVDEHESRRDKRQWGTVHVEAIFRNGEVVGVVRRSKLTRKFR